MALQRSGFRGGEWETALSRHRRRGDCSSGSRSKGKRSGMSLPSPIKAAATSGADLLDQARLEFSRGNLEETLLLSRKVLCLLPEHAEAIHLLGLSLFKLGDTHNAVPLLERSIAASPENASFHANLGVILEAAQCHAAAIASYQRALALDPGCYDSYLNLGNALLRQGHFREAAIALSDAIRLQPHLVGAINSLGVALDRLGSHERAIVCYRKALALKPEYAGAQSNLGASLQALGRYSEAIEHLRHAVRIDPTLADGYVNLSASLRSLGRFADAVRSAQRALELKPTEIEAHLNLGNAYKEQGLLVLASEAYRQAIHLAPDDPRACNNLGETLQDQGRMSEAAAMYRRALQAEPTSAVAYSNLVYLHAFAHDLAAEQELKIARGWEVAALSHTEREQARLAASPSANVFSALPPGGRKVRLGIVSAELGTHAVAEFLEPLLEHLDHDRFHVTLFPTVGRWCARATRFRALADTFVPLVGMAAATAVDRIRHEQIDVLLDTSGHTAGNRLDVFARRAAPVQCTYIGYWSTTGLTEMDWFLSDPDAPSACAGQFSEGLWRLPRIAVCYRGDSALSLEGWTPDLEGTLWLGSLNKLSKIREQTIALWALVLHALPHARLLLEDRGDHEEESHRRIRDGFCSHSIAEDRIEFIPYVPGHERHMLLYNRLDIALDTIPFNSGTTAFDALWMGVPLVALDGDWIGGRMAASVLRTLGRPEWIARDAEEYVHLVRALSLDVELRRRVRQSQRTQMTESPLCDALGLTRALESAFSAMFDEWLNSHQHPVESDSESASTSLVQRAVA